MEWLVSIKFAVVCPCHTERKLSCVVRLKKPARATQWFIDRNKENIIFTPLYLDDPLSDWNQICCRVTHQLEEARFQICRKLLQPFPIYKQPNFDFFLVFFLSLSFHTLCKNCYKTQTRNPIALKFGTYKGRIQVSNLVHIQ